jgi:hypothetical protein
MREVKFEKIGKGSQAWYLISVYENGVLKVSTGDWNRKRLLLENGYSLNTRFKLIKE